VNHIDVSTSLNNISLTLLFFVIGCSIQSPSATLLCQHYSTQHCEGVNQNLKHCQWYIVLFYAHHDFVYIFWLCRTRSSRQTYVNQRMSLSMPLWSLTLSSPHAWIPRLMSYCENLWNPPLSPTRLSMAKVPLAVMVPPQALRVRKQLISENMWQIPWLWCLVFTFLACRNILCVLFCCLVLSLLLVVSKLEVIYSLQLC